MNAARDDTIILNDNVLSSPVSHSDCKMEPIDADAHRKAVEPASGTTEAPAYTTAVDVDRRIDGLADAITSPDIATAIPVSDQELSRNVMLLLQRIRGVPFEGIRTEIYHGCVTLLGAVASAAVSEKIEHEVQSLTGVCSVTNSLMIREIQQ